MKSFKIIIIALVGIFMFTSANAQRGPGQKGEKLKTALELSDEQWEQLQPILEEQHTKMKALRDQDFESREERKAAMKNIQTETEEAAADILTAEQIAKWGEMKEQRPSRKGNKRKARLSEPERKAMKQEMKAYKEKNITPVLQAERLEFDKQISKADKKEITRLRVVMQEKKQAHKDKFKAMKDSGKRPTKEERQAHRAQMKNDPDVQSLKALVEKYREPMTEVYNKLEPKREQWKSDTKEIAKKYMAKSEEKATGERKHSRKHGHKGKGMHKKGNRYSAFLLMDPNKPKTSAKGEKQGKSAVGKFKVYPNPASDNSTVEYTLKQDSHITLSLRDKEGNTIRVLESGDFAKGDHQFEVPLGDLKNGIYYFSIEDKSGKVKSKKVVVNN